MSKFWFKAISRNLAGEECIDTISCSSIAFGEARKTIISDLKRLGHRNIKTILLNIVLL